jgi:nitrogen fixation protein FixH
MTVASVKQFHGRHVLFILIGFFGAMLAVNGIFIYLAVSTFNGLESDAYQKGLHYNDRIDAAGRQAALGWSHKLTLEPDGTVLVSVKDGLGAPVSGLSIAGEITRPVADRFTSTLAFRENVAGTYLASAASLQPGNWIVSLKATRAGSHSGETAYQIKERLWLKPRP